MPARRPCPPGLGARALEHARPCARARSAAPRGRRRRAPPRRAAIAVVQQQDAHRRARLCQRAEPMAIALLTTYLAGYRIPLYQRLAERYGVEVLCFGGGERYVPAWFADLDAPARDAPVPGAAPRTDRVRRSSSPRSYDAVIAPFAGGAILPAAYAGARLRRRPFVLWASVWAAAAVGRAPGGAARDAAHLPARRRCDRLRRARAAGSSPRSADATTTCSWRPNRSSPSCSPAPSPPPRSTSSGAEHSLPDTPIALYVGGSCPRRASTCCSTRGPRWAAQTRRWS